MITYIPDSYHCVTRVPNLGKNFLRSVEPHNSAPRQFYCSMAWALNLFAARFCDAVKYRKLIFYQIHIIYQLIIHSMLNHVILLKNTMMMRLKTFVLCY